MAQSFPARESIVEYFQRVVDGYRSRGIRTCSHSALSTVRLDPRHVLATVTWHLSDIGKRNVVSWRESYLVVDNGDELLIRSSIDHFEGDDR